MSIEATGNCGAILITKIRKGIKSYRILKALWDGFDWDFLVFAKHLIPFLILVEVKAVSEGFFVGDFKYGLSS